MDQRELHQQAWFLARSVLRIALGQLVQPFDQQFAIGGLGLLRITIGKIPAHFQQGQRARILAHEQIAQVACKAGNEEVPIEALLQDRVELHQHRWHIAADKAFGDLEIMLVIEHVQVGHHILVGELVAGKAHQLIENTERIAQAAIGFLRDRVQCLCFRFDPFLRCDRGQVPADVADPDPPEIEHLATAEDRGQDLVLLGGGQDEDRVGGRFLQRFQERIESRR